jgi:hypothetical protein
VLVGRTEVVEATTSLVVIARVEVAASVVEVLVEVVEVEVLCHQPPVQVPHGSGTGAARAAPAKRAI